MRRQTISVIIWEREYFAPSKIKNNLLWRTFVRIPNISNLTSISTTKLYTILLIHVHDDCSLKVFMLSKSSSTFHGLYSIKQLNARKFFSLTDCSSKLLCTGIMAQSQRMEAVTVVVRRVLGLAATALSCCPTKTVYTASKSMLSVLLILVVLLSR